MRFVRVEPFVEPKRSLTNAGTERVDTRVLQVIYALESPPSTVYVGQQIDVFLDASESPTDSGSGTIPDRGLFTVQLADSGTIEPWDPYLPAGLLDDLPTSIKDEGTYNGQFYVWPFLLDVIVQGWNAAQVEQAGLDPEAAPKNWDEFIAAMQKVQKAGYIALAHGGQPVGPCGAVDAQVPVGEVSSDLGEGLDEQIGALGGCQAAAADNRRPIEGGARCVRTGPRSPNAWRTSPRRRSTGAP